MGLPRIAVIGAGPAGLACAKALVDAGLKPELFEKSRGLGGRVATRRRDGLQFDHGAQFLWVPQADDLMRAAAKSGSAAPWPEAEMDGLVPWTGTPRLKDVLLPLADGLSIRYATEIKSLFHMESAWRVSSEKDDSIYDFVAFAATPQQILRVIPEHEAALSDALREVTFAPCHALMVAFDSPPDWPAVNRTPPPPFSLIVSEGSKPERPAGPACYVAHTTANWSAARLEEAPEEIAAELLALMEQAMGPLPPVRLVMGHRWRFSQVETALGSPFAQTADGTLLAGGDWALGRNVEHALASGRAMAESLIQRVGA